MAKKREAYGLVKQLREAIRRSGQSLNQIEKATGVGRDRLSRFLRGERDLTLTAAEKLCQVLHLKLIGGRGSKRKGIAEEAAGN